MTQDEAKALRNAALAETDKLVLPDYPITPFGRWRAQAYRQQLRDWPEAAGFPDPVTMPQPDDWTQYKPQDSILQEEVLDSHP